jgi:hypothetical protein
MDHPPLYRVTAFSIVGPYELDVTFDDGLTQRIDLSDMLEGELFGPLKDLSLFNAVRLDDECDNLVWPNGADFDPATLHDWPEVKGAMIAMAREWAARAAR